MFGMLGRLAWRIAIFAVGAVMLWLTVSELVPLANRHIPLFIVLLLAYCFLSYLVIPSLIRLWRFVIKPVHIPLYVTTKDGWASDPVNIAVIAKNKHHFIRSMQAAGWYLEDPHTLRNLLREGVAMVFNKPYKTAPMSRLYLFNRHHDLGFQAPNNPTGSPRSRHHVRFWRLEEPPMHKKDHGHYHFWSNKLKQLLGQNRELWVGAATEDTHLFGIRWRTGQLTHRISSDANVERDYIIQTLQNEKLVRKLHQTEPGDELRFRGQQTRTVFITDGGITVVHLR